MQSVLTSIPLQPNRSFAISSQSNGSGDLADPTVGDDCGGNPSRRCSSDQCLKQGLVSPSSYGDALCAKQHVFARCMESGGKLCRTVNEWLQSYQRNAMIRKATREVTLRRAFRENVGSSQGRRRQANAALGYMGIEFQYQQQAASTIVRQLLVITEPPAIRASPEVPAPKASHKMHSLQTSALLYNHLSWTIPRLLRAHSQKCLIMILIEYRPEMGQRYTGI